MSVETWGSAFTRRISFFFGADGSVISYVMYGRLASQAQQASTMPLLCMVGANPTQQTTDNMNKMADVDVSCMHTPVNGDTTFQLRAGSVGRWLCDS